MINLTPSEARRTAVTAQHLAGPWPATPARTDLARILHRLRCLQIDPIRAVERTQYLVLWSRLGPYERDLLHTYAYDDKHLFEYWAHAASLVLTADYPIHEHRMRMYRRGHDLSSWNRRLHQWVTANDDFRRYILTELAQHGPLLTGDFEDRATVPWQSGGWSSGRSVAYMLDYLWTAGQIFVARRDGLKRWWDLAERVLPADTPAGGWDEKQVTYEAAQHAVRALGVARADHIRQHFIDGRYDSLGDVLPQLVADGRLIPAAVPEWDGETWYIHPDGRADLDIVRSGNWQPRTTLLSPFDNLIRNRDRTELMWDFYYRIEIYVPRKKREYGYYVLPILHGDRLIGRIDPKMDRKAGVLTINAVYAEPTAATTPENGRSVREAIDQLGRFLGAERIHVAQSPPSGWGNVLRSHNL